MKLIIGLGNPGQRYQATRHNTGFRALDSLAHDASWKQSKKCNADIAQITVASEQVLLAKPQTYMNQSGHAAKTLTAYYHIDLDDVLVVYDDIDLMVGQLRIRSSGSAGGHNGMESILTALNTTRIARLKIGIAEKQTGTQTVPSEQYVLKPFSKTAEKKIQQVLNEAHACIYGWILDAKNTTTSLA